jgi:hypothetical protein
LLLFAKGSESFSGAERSEHRNLSREIQVPFKKKPSDKRGFSLSLSLGGGESGSPFSEEEQRRRVFGLLLKAGSSYLFVWIVVRRKRRTRKKVTIRKTKTRKEFIHCRCLVPLVGGKPGDFETCQEEVCFVCPLSLLFLFWLLFKLDSVFFLVPLVVFCFAIVVGSLLSLSLSFAPCCQGFRRRKKKFFGRRRS